MIFLSSSVDRLGRLKDNCLKKRLFRYDETAFFYVFAYFLAINQIPEYQV